VLILPQRQTALVAKQAAQVDLFSGGRLRLGIGIGWNKVEYDSLNEDFGNRGKRSEEQIEVLRALWTQDVVNFQGQWHNIDDAGINPMPIQRPIPIWIGGEADVVLQRIARIGDGWFPQQRPNDAARGQVGLLKAYVVEAGRKIEDVGIEPRLSLKGVSPDDAVQFARDWRALGASHLTLNTMGMGLKTPQEHINALQEARPVFNEWMG
jgi:probable F420-dependent oxidoreductase